MTQERLYSRQTGKSVWVVLVVLVVLAALGAGGWWGWQQFQQMQKEKAGLAEHRLVQDNITAQSDSCTRSNNEFRRGGI